MKRALAPTKEDDDEQGATKRGRLTDHQGSTATVNKADVEGIKKAIKEKPEWTHKILNPEVLKRYKEEAAAQGANPQMIAVAFRELLDEGITADLGQSVDFPQGNEDYYEDDDDDFRTAEYDRYPDRPYEGLCFKDELIPEPLRAALEAHLDVIANSPEKDFHPGTDGKIQDLFHPSLFPYVRGESYVPNESEEEQEAESESAKTEQDNTDVQSEMTQALTEERSDENVAAEEYEKDEDSLPDYPGFNKSEEREYLDEIAEFEAWDSIYQWLPAEYHIDAFGEVMIESYINNLDRKAHPELYNDIAMVFRYFLPLFYKVVPRYINLSAHRTLQVITKAANYILKPGDTYEGNWHVEGMRHEHIVASGIFYYSTTPNLAGSALAFREERDNDYQRRSYTTNMSFYKNLGKVDTPMGRCLVFANWLQHKVKAMINNSDTMGVRKILCFFLVDPNHRIKSSLDVPEQQWDMTKHGVALALCSVVSRLKLHVPPELLRYIVTLAKWGFALEEAQAHRLALMEDRKYYIDANNRIWERPFSFCEH